MVTFIEEVVSCFETHPHYNLSVIKISLMVNNDYLFIIHELDLSRDRLPLLIKDFTQICKLRKVNIRHIKRIFIKITLEYK